MNQRISGYFRGMIALGPLPLRPVLGILLSCLAAEASMDNCRFALHYKPKFVASKTIAYLCDDPATTTIEPNYSPNWNSTTKFPNPLPCSSYDYTCEPATNVCAISGQAPRALLVNPNPPHAPRRTASLAGFLDFSHVLHGPLRYGASIRFETMPSRPMPLSTWLAGQAIRTIERAIRMAESSALFVSDGEFIRSARCGGRLSERQPAVSPSEHHDAVQGC